MNVDNKNNKNNNKHNVILIIRLQALIIIRIQILLGSNHRESY